MPEKKIPLAKRTAKYYNSEVNVKLRKLVTSENINEFADSLGISHEAVRQWTGGYTRPNIEKLVGISRFFSVSVGWLLGAEKDSTTDISLRDIGKRIGLSQKAIERLVMIQEPLPEPFTDSRALNKIHSIERSEVRILSEMIDNSLFFLSLEHLVHAEIAIEKLENKSGLYPSNTFHHNKGDNSVTLSGKDSIDFFKLSAVQNFGRLVDNYIDRLISDRETAMSKSEV